MIYLNNEIVCRYFKTCYRMKCTDMLKCIYVTTCKKKHKTHVSKYITSAT
jgi:hypothetical protein